MFTKLDLYKIFREVAKNKSFSKAAKELFMTQPAVSRAIMNLENDLNIRLFTRTSKGVILTNEGQLLFEYVNSAINLIQTGENKLMELKNLTVGEMRVGVGDTISKYFLLPYLARFHDQFPHINLKIMNRTTPELCAMLKSGEADIAVCNLPVRDAALETMKCIDVHDIFVCGEKFKSVASSPKSLEEIAAMPLILLERKSNSRMYVERYFSSKGIKVTAEIELGSHDLLLEFARYNFGIACVVEEFSQEYLRDGILHKIDLTEEIPARSIGFCFLKSVHLSSAAQKLVDIVRY